MKTRLKINGTIIVLSLVVLSLFPGFFMRDHSANFWEESAEILGFAFILLGQLFRTSARGYKAAFSQEGKALIQTGPYAFVRNPMYLGIFLIGLGIVMVLLTWQAAFIVMAVFITRYYLLILDEEKRLRVLFPRDYAGYCQKVPRFFPSVASVISQDMRDYLPLGWVWLKKEAGTILLVLAGVFVVDAWVDLKNEGAFVYSREFIWLALVLAWFVILMFYLTGTAPFKKYALRKGNAAL
ncbi:MAG: isoprenylcysteine carboxylmethyltransferase family protein [Candidatus Omnitrophica bacterium]|nr:isoprenylcysteine carboxylmethyltransferase family protein [Candidatus Omnitrophota bacterium]